MKKQNQIERKNNRGSTGLQGRKPATAGPEIPENWKEVANVDFTGYLDRDCNERIIYKTPEGTLKALKCDTGSRFIEDVTRAQVVRWLHECVIPEEFEADFSPTLHPRPGDVRQLSELEVIELERLYNMYSEKSFNDAMAGFAALAELMAENTAPEVQALKRMVEAEAELNKIRSKAMAI